MADRQLQRAGLPPALEQRLRERNFASAKDLYSRSVVDLVEALDLPYETVERILQDVAHKILPPPVTALDLLHRSAASPAHLRTLLPPLDDALRGGLPAGSITEVVGPAGLGKTQLCLTMCVVGCMDRVAAHGRVLYLDTERKFSAERLSQIARERFPGQFPTPASLTTLLDRVLVQEPKSSADLLKLLEGLQAAIIDHSIKLIIIDSIAALARTEFEAHAVAERQRMLGQQASRLKFLAESFRIPVLVTNQVTTAIGGRAGAAPQAQAQGTRLMAALGPMWAHAVNTRLVLAAQQDAQGEQLRVLTVAKSPSAPNVALAYRVTAAGLEWLEGVTPPAPEPGSVVDMVIANYQAYEAGGGGQ